MSSMYWCRECNKSVDESHVDECPAFNTQIKPVEIGTNERKCSGGYIGCVTCGAGPHQPCNWDWDRGCRKGEPRSRIIRWFKTTTIRTRLSLIVLALEAMVVGGLIVKFIHEFI